ncbi:Hypothetical predicted protein [Mytilus galloprovincialis]|uniref:Uncharacterized protein n=1 Tax=Mytilus galloprovincialis TaxID=29158 RepID=A0A8B6CIB8_MYTGA|nr:Hypothetical predicted protein [Mytilus galloprovincialis]
MPTVILQFVFLLIALDIRHVFGQSCTNLANPAHGRVRLRARGRIAKFRCYREFKLFGGKLIICSGNKWSLPPPVCIRNGCDEIQSSENLTVTKDQGGAVLEFKCAPPLKLIGKKLITCDGTAWSAPVPLCKYVEPGNYCDFEDENICGWQHDELANFEWKWNYGTTPSRRTGPTYDHTLGKGGNGHYMFMESSSPIKRNDKARLLSPYFPATTGNLCFEIWYHMWSATGYGQVGRLKIYIEDMAQTDMLSQTSKLEVSGNQGDEWIKGQFPVGERKTSFRIIIEGTKLKSYLSDISVDDPKLYNCSDDYTDSTRSNQEETTIDTTESVVQTTTMYHRPFQTTEASSSLATTVTSLVKTTENLAAFPTDYVDTRRNQEITANNTTEAAVQNPTQTVLLIGIGVGIVITLMIVTSAIYAHHKKSRKQNVFEDKEEQIARKYLFEIYKYGKDSDVDYHFET